MTMSHDGAIDEGEGASPALTQGKERPNQLIQQERRQDARGSTAWQRSLKDFLILVFLLLTFVFITLISVKFLSVRDDTALQGDAFGVVASQIPGIKDENLQIQAALEFAVTKSRYQQASLLLRTRTDMGYMGFLSGLTIALLGALFVFGKIKEDTSSASGKVAGGSVRIVSTSPGLILALAGLLFAAMVQYTARPIELRDAPVYLRNGPSTDALSPPLELPHTVDQVLKKEVKKTNVDDTCK